MPDAGLRARVERLLRGDLRIDDLTRLFLYVRDRCDGREPVREIASQKWDFDLEVTEATT